MSRSPALDRPQDPVCSCQASIDKRNEFLEVHGSVVASVVKRKARKLLSHPAFGRSEQEDIEQELRLAVLRRANRYDCTRGGVTKFLLAVVRSKAASLIRKREAAARDYRRNGTSLNERMLLQDGQSAEHAETLSESVSWSHTGQRRRLPLELAQLHHDLRQVLDRLPTDLRELADLLRSRSVLAAGRDLGKSRRAVAADLKQLRKHCERADLRGYL